MGVVFRGDSSFGNSMDTGEGNNISVGNSDAVTAVPDSLIDLLPEETRAIVREWQFKVQFYAGVISDDLDDAAQRLILTGAMNDALCLVRQIDRSEGRAAAFSARVLFEHAVNFSDVSQSSVNTSERFLAHDWVTSEQLGNRRWHLDFLDSRERKRQRNFLDGLKARARRFFNDAPKEYQSGSFRRGWTKDSNLRDRAGNHGIEEYYDGYKILSDVIHGSSGGLQGLVLQRQAGVMHRLGPDLHLVSLAYQEGLRFFAVFIQAVQAVASEPETEEIQSLTIDLLNHMQDMNDLLVKVDKTISPGNLPPQTRVAFVALYRSGKKRWYLHDTRLALTCVAAPPELEPDLTKAWEAAEESGAWEAGFPNVVAVPETRLYAKDNSWWVEHHKIFPHLLDET